jgi:hypothetical protein
MIVLSRKAKASVRCVRCGVLVLIIEKEEGKGRCVWCPAWLNHQNTMSGGKCVCVVSSFLDQ